MKKNILKNKCNLKKKRKKWPTPRAMTKEKKEAHRAWSRARDLLLVPLII